MKLIALVTTSFGILNIFWLHNAIIGTFLIIAYFLSLGFLIGQHIDKDGTLFEQFVWGTLSLLLVEIVLNTIAYYVFGVTPLTVAITFLLLPLALFVFRKYHVSSIIYHVSHTTYHIPKKQILLTILPIFLDLVLLFLLYTHRILDVVPSPWMIFTYRFFILYGIATAALFFAVYKINNTAVRWALTALHLFVTFGIAPILYPLGFGFDGFIHRATETWIFEHGSITPIRPYYIGQYSLIVWLAHLTRIPIFYLDVYLVPLLASISLPAVVMTTLKRVWNIEEKYAALLVWLIPFVYFLSLHLTTPHNLVILFMILTIFTTLSLISYHLSPIIPLILALASLATHPLLGAPIMLFVLTALIIRKLLVTRYRLPVTTLLIYTILIALTVPLLFTIFLFTTGHGLPAFVNPFDKFSHFLALFKRPYWYASNSPLIFELLYTWERMIALIVITGGVTGFITYYVSLIKKNAEHRVLNVGYWIFPASFLGFLLGAYLLRSWIIFPGVGALEQGDYPMRLLKTSLIFLLPFAMYALTHITYHVSRITKQLNRKLWYVLCGTCYVTVLTVSLYLSYPQRNPKVFFPGFNVSLSDFKAVEWIHNNNEEYNYIVLANPLLAAAALNKYNFVKDFPTSKGPVFYYSIPSGGPLFKLYERMLYEGQKREYIDEVVRLTGATKVYFVVNNYWSNFEKIVEGAKKTADSFYEVDEGKVVIFTYF